MHDTHSLFCSYFLIRRFLLCSYIIHCIDNTAVLTINITADICLWSENDNFVIPNKQIIL